jgi:hypothetical protein
MGEPMLCVEGKVYNLGLSVVVAAGSPHTVAATSAPVTDGIVCKFVGELLDFVWVFICVVFFWFIRLKDVGGERWVKFGEWVIG